MHEYSFSPQRSIRPQSKRLRLKSAALFICLILVIYTAYRLRTGKTNPSSSSLGQQTVQSGQPAARHFASENEFLEEVEKEMGTVGGTVTFYLVDLNVNSGIGINEQTVITAASVNKIPILATLYHQAGSGTIDLEKIITLQQQDIQDFGTGSIRYDKPGTVYSIKTLARLMMEKSDNTAAHILSTAILDIDTIQAYMNELGLVQTDIADNKTSAKDISMVLIKMYRGEITTAALKDEMLGFMDKSDFDDRIPAGVDPDIAVFHKTGDEINKIHDAGIVDLPNRPYFIGVFTTDQTDEERAKEVIRNISRITFEYMKQ